MHVTAGRAGKSPTRTSPWGVSTWQTFRQPRAACPQIEVIFDIDANGIMNVSARDKATGKQQSIIIKASSGLSDEEIQRMVQDAEDHAADDAKMRTLIDKRNQGEQLVHATERTMADLADQIDDAERADINEKLDGLREALKGEDIEAIEAKQSALSEVTGKLAEKAYAQKVSEEEAAGGAEPDEGGKSGTSANASNDDAVDAEFEEVKEDKAS